MLLSSVYCCAALTENLFHFFIHTGGNCKCYAFCSRKCQALFWKAGGHKKVCDSLKQLRENGLSVADIRESDGDPSKLLDMDKTPSSKPFQCCSVKGCKCVTKEGDHVAVYRQLDGESFFTGMVATVDGSGQIDFSKMRKLHNAGDDINDGVSYFDPLDNCIF